MAAPGRPAPPHQRMKGQVFFLRKASSATTSFGACVKGTDDIVIENGVVNQETLRRNDFSERDLLENLRLHGVESPAEVRSARIERNGDVSVVRGKPPNG